MRKILERGIHSKVLIAFLDALIVMFSGALGILFRFEFKFDAIPGEIGRMWFRYLPYQIIIAIAMFSILRMYGYVWRILGLKDLLNIIASTVITYIVANEALIPFGFDMPLSIRLISMFWAIVLITTMRFTPRMLAEIYYIPKRRESQNEIRVLLIGAGVAGRMILQEYSMSGKLHGNICCIIDDNPNKWNKSLCGVKIHGGREKIPECVEKFKIKQILFAIPSISRKEQRAILEICGQTGVPVKIIPSISDLVSGEAKFTDVRDVSIGDILGRDTVKLNPEKLKKFITGKTILVTGGGGSIGSELCRQIAKCNPKSLIVVDVYENTTYQLQIELEKKYRGYLDLHIEIASVCDESQLNLIFEKYRPNVVFHAAAHKHVPLMEQCPLEAIKNNIFGTYHTVCAAERVGVEKFVLISTDKAVNPTNVMGATKRFCEMILQSRFASKTEFCCVRFGNVLGSNGSVVPLFEKQIAEGGPVTVTDKRVTRFFMTIPEASQLVLEAGAMAEQGQIFVLDMGEPVKIIDLAENLIRLSGFEPNIDIAVIEIGLRPGEKLYEELLIKTNNLSSTENEKIFVEQQQPIPPERMNKLLDEIREKIAEKVSADECVNLLRGLIPSYHSPEEINTKVEANS